MDAAQWYEVLKLSGPAGMMLLGCILALRRLDERVEKSYAQRIEDAQKTTAMLIKVIDDQHRVNDSLAGALRATNETVGDPKAMLQQLIAERSQRR